MPDQQGLGLGRGASIRSHYEKCWGQAEGISPFNKGPVSELPSDFDVLVLPPCNERIIWTYATVGMAQPGDDEPMELHLFSPYRSDEITEILYAVGHFHRTGTRLDLGHSVNFGHPWLPGSQCDHGLVSLPYLDGPKLEVGQIGTEWVRFYWLVPITTGEKVYKVRHGLEALETLFEEGALDYVNPARPSMA
jgi:hypothetical protein